MSLQDAQIIYGYVLQPERIDNQHCFLLLLKATPQRREDPGLPHVAEPEQPDTVPASAEDIRASMESSSPTESELRVAAPSSPTSSLPPSASRVGENDVL